MPFSPAPSVYVALHSLMHIAANNNWVVWKETSKDITTKPLLFVDASNYRYGWVAVYKGRMTQGTSLFSKSEVNQHINVKEALALEYALVESGLDDPFIYSDNTTVVLSFKKGFSANPYIDKIIRNNYKKLCGIRYVGSKDNPADEPSRDRVVNIDKLNRIDYSNIEDGDMLRWL